MYIPLVLARQDGRKQLNLIKVNVSKIDKVPHQAIYTAVLDAVMYSSGVSDTRRSPFEALKAKKGPRTNDALFVRLA